MHFSPKIKARHECWPLANTFTIARGSKDSADVVVCTLSQDGYVGRGECVPYARYGESVASVFDQIKHFAQSTSTGFLKSDLQRKMPAGAARFAVDAALWDLEAKLSGTSVFESLGIAADRPLTTAYTISYASADTMHRDAQNNAARPLLKIKLAHKDDLERLIAVREGAPKAKLIVDANEGWTLTDFEAFAPHLETHGVIMVEQPLPAGADSALKAGQYPFDLCADESCHDRARLDALIGHYDMINIKLDKTGGLTEALALKEAARTTGIKIMIGCMVSTSLAMAPAMAVAYDADVVDLDGPLLMKQDRTDGIDYKGSQMYWPSAALWGA